MEKLNKIIIKPKLTIKEALKLIDQSGQKILFVVNNQGQLIGTITDGDIRKWILKNKSLNQASSFVMNSQPIYLKESYSMDEAKDLMVAKRIECLPILDERRKIVSAIWWLDLFENKPKRNRQFNLPVVIMAGGKGTRLSPLTRILPKPLMPIGDKPIMEMIIDRFFESGCREFYLTLNYKSNIIKAYFNEFKHSYKLNYIYEDKPLGTAGSLYLLRNKIKGTFFVTNCDILIDADYEDILKFHKDNGNAITIVGSMKHYKIPYGICEIKNDGCLKKIKEKPEYDFLANTGMYILEPETLKCIPKNQFYLLTDLINENRKRGNKVGVYPVSDKSWIDIGQWEELQNILR